MFGNSKNFIWFALGTVLLFGSISWVNHVMGRTSILDLGLYTNWSWMWSHGELGHDGVLHGLIKGDDGVRSALAVHFDLWLLLLSPLVRLWGAWGLLVPQVLAVAFGAWGLHRWALFSVPRLRWWLPIHWVSFFGIWHALAFDFHSEVIAAALIPWWWMAFEKGQSRAWLILPLILIAKEDLAVAMVAVGLTAAWLHRGDRTRKSMALRTAAVSTCFFAATLLLWMPAFSTGGVSAGAVSNLNYPIWERLLEPGGLSLGGLYDAVAVLWTSPDGHPKQAFKIEFWSIFGLSGGVLLLRRPALLLLVLPTIAIRMGHGNPQMWGIHSQYNVVLAPLLILGVANALNWNNIPRWSYGIVIALSICMLHRSIYCTSQWVIEDRTDPLRENHWTPVISADDRSALHLVLPADAALCISSIFSPHFASRRHLYRVPHHQHAEYIVYTASSRPYPESPSDIAAWIKSCQSSPDWQTVAHPTPGHIWDQLIVLKRAPLKTTGTSGLLNTELSAK